MRRVFLRNIGHTKFKINFPPTKFQQIELADRLQQGISEKIFLTTNPHGPTNAKLSFNLGFKSSTKWHVLPSTETC